VRRSQFSDTVQAQISHESDVRVSAKLQILCSIITAAALMRLFSGLLLLGLAFAQVPSPSLPSFRDAAHEAGLTVSHISSPDKKYIVETMSRAPGLSYIA